MEAGAMVASGVVLVLLVFVLLGGPMFLVDWSRKRRQMAIQRQIMLTEALDGRLGAIVAPVVKKPLLGPWEIQIAMPFLPSAAVGRILSVVDEVFSSHEGMGSSSYRIFFRAKQDAPGETGAYRTLRSRRPCIHDPIAAA
jgi:hypothetical protein